MSLAGAGDIAGVRALRRDHLISNRKHIPATMSMNILCKTWHKSTSSFFPKGNGAARQDIGRGWGINGTMECGVRLAGGLGCAPVPPVNSCLLSGPGFGRLLLIYSAACFAPSRRHRRSRAVRPPGLSLGILLWKGGNGQKGFKNPIAAALWSPSTGTSQRGNPRSAGDTGEDSEQVERNHLTCRMEEAVGKY